MDNSNTQPAGSPVTPAASTPESTTPASSTPASSTPASSTPTSTPVAPSSSNGMDKKKITTILIVVGVLIVLSVVLTAASKASANKRLNKTIAICEEYGLLSTECKDAQSKNDVTCNIVTRQCEATYHRFIFF